MKDDPGLFPAMSYDDTLYVGQTFPDYLEFHACIQRRQDVMGERWSKSKGCCSIQSANVRMRDPSLHYRTDLKSQKIGCPVKMTVAARRDCDALVIVKLELQHSHQLVDPSTLATCIREHSPPAVVTGAEVFQGSWIRLKEMVKGVIPPLTNNKHKGQAGRVAVIGGCKDYTGAPYFAAITALKVGADLSHVFCTEGAGTVIKSYSPELIVHATLDHPDAVSDFCEWLPRFHSLIIGPGLGREQHLLDNVTQMILKAKQRHIPLILDADAVFLVSQNVSIIKDYPAAILTPNSVEFERLYHAVTGKQPDPDTDRNNVVHLSQLLGNITIVAKGPCDIISNGSNVVSCDRTGSPRRCGGQGDLLSGSMGVLAYWAQQTCENSTSISSDLEKLGPSVCAAYGACLLTRVCAEIAFAQHKRQMTTTEMIAAIHSAYTQLFDDQ